MVKNRAFCNLGTKGCTIFCSNLLVATKTYPDSPGGSDVVNYTYNRAQQLTTSTAA